MNEKRKYICENLKKLRLKKGMTIEDLSEETGLAESTIENIENEITFQSRIDTIVILSSYFNEKVHDFVYKEL